MLLGIIHVTLNKKTCLRVVDLNNLCSPEMCCMGMVINI